MEKKKRGRPVGWRKVKKEEKPGVNKDVPAMAPVYVEPEAPVYTKPEAPVYAEPPKPVEVVKKPEPFVNPDACKNCGHERKMHYGGLMGWCHSVTCQCLKLS